MKNITFSADEKLIDDARKVAKARNTTLNQMFRDWLNDMAPRGKVLEEYEALMKKILKSGARGGRKFTREEMNER